MDERHRADEILAAVRRAPQWVRIDLASVDRTLRDRAEETMAAMVSAALTDAVARSSIQESPSGEVRRE